MGLQLTYIIGVQVCGAALLLPQKEDNMKINFLKKFASIALCISMLMQSTVFTIAATNGYTFNQLTYSSSYGTTHSVSSSGVLSLTFDGQYQEIKYLLPESVNLSKCNSVVFNAAASDNIAFKLYTSDDEQAEVIYDCKASSASDFTITPTSGKTVNKIGIMNCADKSDVTAKVNKVSFNMSSSAADTSNATLLNTYGSTLGKMGTCINLSQLKDADTLAFVKKHFNSVTLENEMKPDSILRRWSKQLITVDEAKSKGYYIPSNYTESTVPLLNFDSVDATLKICSENGLKMRAHTLVWHSQTPTYFFREGYSETGDYVSSEVMNARLEFYVKTVMNHVYTGNYGDVVYTWDVANEYINAKTADKSDWVAVYGEQGNTPVFVKSAFQYANETLEYFNLRDSVSLMYNDFNTYMNTDAIIEMINYLNKDKKLCDGVGMQSHLGTSFPSVSSYKNTLQKFADAGLEIHVTELDVTNKNNLDQPQYYYDIVSSILSVKKNGGNITGLTVWGLYDSVSWIVLMDGNENEKPLLFTDTNTPKDEYYKVIDAYFDAGYTISDSTETTTETTTQAATETTTQKTTEAATETTTTAPVVTGGISHNFDDYGTSSSYYTISGNTSTSKGSCTYGGRSYTTCLKIESSTSITFNAAAAGELTLVFGGSTDPAGKKVKIDGTAYTVGSDGILTVSLSSGEHKITKGDAIFLYYMNFGSGTSTATTETTTETTTTTTTTQADVSNMPGDVDNDKDVDNADAALLLKHILNTAVITDTVALANADCDGISGIDMRDVIWILNHTQNSEESTETTTQPTAGTPLDLSGALLDSGSYDSSTGSLTMSDVLQFKLTLPTQLAAGEQLKVYIGAKDTGGTGFRSWLTDDGNSECSDVYTRTDISADGENMVYTLTATGNTDYLLFKGPSWDTNMGNITFNYIRVEYPKKGTALDLSSPLIENGSYDSASGTLTMTDISQFKLALPKTLASGSSLKVYVNAADNGSTGFRSWVTDDSNNSLSNITAFTTDEINSGELEYTLTATADTNYLLFKGATYDTNIGNVTFSSVRVEYIESLDIALTSSYSEYNGQLVNNPLVTHQFMADPTCVVYNDRVYVYGTTDIVAYDSNGDIADNAYAVDTLSVISSSDLVNWRDEGKIDVGNVTSWASNSWAPSITSKTVNGKTKFYLYFANGASGIGVLTADSPTGPWSDPLGKALITRSTPNCSDVPWMFDPGVFVDDDGTGYIAFGGGISDNTDSSVVANPKSARIVKLGSDMISLDGTPQVIDSPYMFEDSELNKINGKYVYSYCTNWQYSEAASIAYMTSDKPLSGYEFKQVLALNPGKTFGLYYNNHHHMFEFKGSWYLLYHTTYLENKIYGTSKGYRSMNIDKIDFDSDGNMTAAMTYNGVSAAAKLNPYSSVNATTMAWNGGVSTSYSSTAGAMVLDGISTGDWVGLENVAFTANGAGKVSFNAISSGSGKIYVMLDAPSTADGGTLAATVNISDTGSAVSTFTAELNQSVTGNRKLYFVFEGSGYTIKDWSFTAA